MSALKTTLTIERFGRSGRLLEQRKQLSRSFTIGLLEGLYVAHGQIGYGGGGYIAVNLDGVKTIIDASVRDNVNNAYGSSNLRIGSPGSIGCIEPVGYENGNGGVYHQKQQILNADLGILIGAGSAAVTPTDRRMTQLIGHGQRPPDVAPVMFENYTDSDTDDYVIRGTNWGAQAFIPYTTHQLTSIWIKGWRTGSCGVTTVALYGSDEVAGANHTPTVGTCNVLGSGTIDEATWGTVSPGALQEAVLTTPVDVIAGHRYFIVVSCPTGSGGNQLQWRYNSTAYVYEMPLMTNAYGLQIRDTSNDSGASWTRNNGAFLFQEFGQSAGEFQIGGTEVYNLVISDPTGSFDIRRTFFNACGQTITVNECGIAHVQQHDLGGAAQGIQAQAFMCAHDLTGTITIDDGQLLVVKYTPSITV